MKHIVVLTGAGMSAESGIATFRDSGGLWEQHAIEDVATPEGFQRNPQLVLDFYNERRKAAFGAKPNKGHIGLAEMESDYKISIITQNVDNLHERAGSTNVIHLHGELNKVRSTADPSLIYTLTSDKPEINIGDKCEKGSQLRPHIVWFGEAVPMIEKAAEITQQADILVVIGTSLNVYPAAGLINYTKQNTPIYLIDPKEVKTNIKSIHFIQKGASEGVEELREILKLKYS
ncbi:NAD-dependent deacylase [Dysgonomonas sp. Marseille-P4677]|uniref:SIR2 family NAD-dependent protein deacylase n=1 Tax=Dysgonomonas sp. Marseille-P4677 TaxID=2364790 RepID=UPI001914D956|nr:NAD-dependent deacylase [Dysgonomonas sp. Marseille-P4677]MBK5720068.1 NAD-dependent deacylase [Dysgonomonas sp. Marseille-P4677]